MHAIRLARRPIEWIIWLLTCANVESFKILFLAFVTIPCLHPDCTAMNRRNHMIRDANDYRAGRRKAREELLSAASAKAALLREYHSALDKGPYSVTFKIRRAPSGCKHDYLSVGPYWWPNPDTVDGMPYVRHDGMVNPEVLQLDGHAIRNMVADTTRLLLVGMLLDKREAFDRAALLLRTWFLDEETRMNPHLQYAQAINGVCSGRGIGLIDTSGLCGLLWQLSLLDEFPGWTGGDHAGLIRWFSNYLDWLLNSSLGKDESEEYNNHGTWYDAQICCYSSFIGDANLAKDQLASSLVPRIHSQIAEDGSMPHEVTRTLPVHYSLFNLQGFLFCALHGRKLGINLFDRDESCGKKLHLAADWFCRHVFSRAGDGLSQLRPLRKGLAAWSFARLSELNGDGPWDELLGVVSRFRWQQILYRHMRTDEHLLKSAGFADSPSSAAPGEDDE